MHAPLGSRVPARLRDVSTRLQPRLGVWLVGTHRRDVQRFTATVDQGTRIPGLDAPVRSWCQQTDPNGNGVLAAEHAVAAFSSRSEPILGNRELHLELERVFGCLHLPAVHTTALASIRWKRASRHVSGKCPSAL